MSGDVRGLCYNIRRRRLTESRSMTQRKHIKKASKIAGLDETL